MRDINAHLLDSYLANIPEIMTVNFCTLPGQYCACSHITALLFIVMLKCAKA